MRSRSGKKLLILFLLIAVAVSCAVLVKTVSVRNADSASRATAGNEASSTEASKEEADSEQKVRAAVFFASDYQAEPGWPDPAETLDGILAAVSEDGKVPDNVVFCGDYSNDRKLHDYQISPDESIREIKDLVASRFSNIRPEDMIFVQGNHDHLTDSISVSGLHEYDDYLVYVLNTQNDFPWKQGKTSGCLDKVTTASQEMKKCFDELIAAGETRPVFIAGHVPLHFTGRTSSKHGVGDNLYASLIFDVVNDAAESLDIIYMAGHNHSKGWDCYLGGSSRFSAPGETILIPEFDKNYITTDKYLERTLNFTYMNAGYTGYYMNCGTRELDNGTADQYTAADETLTGTLCEIQPEEIVITRYSSEGVHPIRGEGEADPYRGYIDRGLIPEAHYVQQIGSPQHIGRKAVK